jgi:hypothetical protein
MTAKQVMKTYTIPLSKWYKLLHKGLLPKPTLGDGTRKEYSVADIKNIEKLLNRKNE